MEVWYLPHLPLPQHLDQQVSHVCLDCYSSYLLSSPETTAGYSNKHGNNSKKISKRAVGDGTWEKAGASAFLSLPFPSSSGHFHFSLSPVPILPMTQQTDKGER